MLHMHPHQADTICGDVQSDTDHLLGPEEDLRLSIPGVPGFELHSAAPRICLAAL